MPATNPQAVLSRTTHGATVRSDEPADRQPRTRFRRAFASVLAAALSATGARAQLAGDECGNAIVATPGANGPVNTASYTASANPPANGPCAYLQWFPTTRDVWWVFDAPVAGMLTVELCDSTFDTSVVVYRGSCAALERIACDDDSCAPTGPTYQSKIDRLPVASGRHFIRVGGYEGATGQVRFNLTYEPVGTAECWGYEGYGQTNVPPTVDTVIGIAAGEQHTVAMKPDGSVVCWGWDFFGQCSPPTGLVARKIAIGAYHSFAIQTDGTVVCWGRNEYGQATVPAGLGTVIEVDGGRFHSIALKSNRTVACWGDNEAGQCTVPAGLGPVAAVSAGAFHSVVATTGGTVACWGRNDQGQAAVPAGLGSVVAVSGGRSHTAALRSDRTVACWGSNEFGQSTVPPGLGNVTAISAGGYHTVALKLDGTVVSFGDAIGAAPLTATTVGMISAGNRHNAAVGIYDCDRDGLVDKLEELEANDCNGNGVHDCWDVGAGIVEDCDGNLRDDTCEKQVSVALASGQMGPIGHLAPRTWAIENAVPAVDVVTLRVRAHGDFSGALEYLRLVVGDLFDEHALAGTGDCVVVPEFATFMLEPDEFNSGIGADGTWRLDVIPASAVDRFRCADGTWVEATLAYTGAAPSDCDANGELDSCQIAAGTVPDANGNGVIDSCESGIDACPTDLDGDHVTGALDLAQLLGAWGSAKAGSADLDGDGVVGASDLASLLAAWGDCLSR